MSAKFETVKRHYNMGFWEEKQVRNAVVKGWITAEEFRAITGKDF